MKTKGIILAGGTGSRLYPITRGVCKQLLPVYDKPMIYYPLSVLMLAGIKEILIVSNHAGLTSIKKMFNDGSGLGLSLSYACQDEPRGIAEALIIGERFIGRDKVSLILGDNVFFGHGLPDLLKKVISCEKGATVFGYCVKDPQRYCIMELDKRNNVVSMEEKPVNPKSNWAVTGLYFYDNDAVEIAKGLKPSKRGELEIADVNNAYLRKKRLRVEFLGRGYAWLDTGTHNSLIDASLFIKTIEERQGLKIGCIEEVAYRMGYIDRRKLMKISTGIGSEYGDYLKRLANEQD